MKDPDAVRLGRKGGKVSSPAKIAAAKANGKLGGYPKHKKNHPWSHSYFGKGEKA